MIICEFCRHFQDRACRLGLNLPKAMSCREFDPSREQFGSDPKEFVDPAQIMQMARFFGFQRSELKKIKIMAIDEQRLREQKRIIQGETPHEQCEPHGWLPVFGRGGTR